MMNPLLKLKNKFSKESLSTGLDIGTQAIKIVKLRSLREKVELCGFDLEPVQPDLGEVLKKIKESQSLQTVNISACGPSTVIRYVNFPIMQQEELRRSLRFEAQKYIPFSIDEVNLDGYILRKGLPDNKMLVLLAAVKKEFINQRLKIIENAGFKVNVVDIDSIALINAFNFNYSQEENLKNKTIGLLNIGSSISSLDILEQGAPVLSRDIHIAGNNFTQKLQDAFGLDSKSAEDLKVHPIRNITETIQDGKISNGVHPDSERSNKVVVTLESVLTNLSAELRTSFDYYESQSASSVAKIFLSGGGSLVTGLKDMLANFFGIEVEYWDPLKNINLSSDLEPGKIRAISSQLAVAVGLALRH